MTMSRQTRGWGLELGRDRVVLVHLAHKEAGCEAEELAFAPLSADWQGDGPPPWARAVRELGISSPLEPLTVSISDELLLYRSLSLPAADEATLGLMIDAQAEAALPQPDVLEWAWGRMKSEGDTQRVLLCAMRADIQRAAWEAARLLGEPVWAAPSGLAIARALNMQGRCMLVHIGPRHTSLIAMMDGQITGCAQLDSGAEDWPQGDSAAWARQVAESYSVMRSQIPHGQQPERAVWLGGSHAAAAALEDALGFPVQAAELIEGLRFAPGVAAETAIGAAAAASLHLQRVDPALCFRVDRAAERADAARAAPRLLQRRGRLVAAAIWIIAAVLMLYALDRAQAGRLERAVEALRESNSDGGGLEGQARVARYLEQTPTPPLPLLHELSTLAPRTIVLKQLDFGEGQLRFEGYTHSVNELDELLQKLAASPLFADVALRSAMQNEQTRQWTFEVTAQAAPVFRYIAHASAPAPANPPAPQSTRKEIAK